MRKTYLFVLILITFETCSNSKKITQWRNKDPIQSFFVDLPDSIFTYRKLQYNFSRYDLNINNNLERGKIFTSTLETPDSISSDRNNISIYLGERYDTPCEIHLRAINFKTKTYSIINLCYAELWDETNFHIFQYIKGSLIECTKDVLPKITLSDFIRPSYLSQFSQEYINNPYLIFSYQSDQSDTLKVRFESEDHPFFEKPGSDSTIKKKEILLVWKKNRFVKVDQ